MIKTYQKSVTKDFTFIEEIICNKCGKSHRPYREDIEVQREKLVNHVHSFLFRLRGNFDSKRLYDTTTYCFAVCEDCMMDFMKSFAIVPETFDMDGACPFEDQGNKNESVEK